MTYNDRSTPLTLLATRRSGKPRDMTGPAPDDAQLAEMLRLAARTPDHGKLFPWRFVVIPAAARPAFADLLEAAARAADPDARPVEIAAARDFARPELGLVAVTSRPTVPAKIPLWEQELSAGAATMNLLHAAHAMGFVASWITGWPAYAPAVAEALAPGERIAGFVFIGHPARPLEERPRPEMPDIVRVWEGGQTP